MTLQTPFQTKRAYGGEFARQFVTSQFMETGANPPPPPPLQKIVTLHLTFEELAVDRRAALELLPDVQDPECQSKMALSRLKSSRRYKFIDDSTVTLSAGYRLCRATRWFPSQGSYFWEVKFVAANDENSHIRLGIATIKAEMEGPVGMDEEGYSVRDRGGAFHQGKKTPTPGFGVGDVIGFGFSHDGNGATLRVWINGTDQGVVFRGIDDNKRWYPAVSVYRDAEVRVTFARPFAFDPGNGWEAASDLPRVEPVGLFTTKQLIHWMKGRLDAGDLQEQAYNAIDKAMTPAHLMPI